VRQRVARASNGRHRPHQRRGQGFHQRVRLAQLGEWADDRAGVADRELRPRPGDDGVDVLQPPRVSGACRPPAGQSAQWLAPPQVAGLPQRFQPPAVAPAGSVGPRPQAAEEMQVHLPRFDAQRIATVAVHDRCEPVVVPQRAAQPGNQHVQRVSIAARWYVPYPFRQSGHGHRPPRVDRQRGQQQSLLRRANRGHLGVRVYLHRPEQSDLHLVHHAEPAPLIGR
jgi:hypothetical protein